MEIQMLCWAVMLLGLAQFIIATTLATRD